MRSFFILLPVFLYSFTIHWVADINKAKQAAAAEHKFILLNFSGSDWCGPCIRLHKEIFESDTFAAFAENNLVMVNADFPRQKKNQLSKIQQQQNDKLADKYNAAGNFPYTLLLNADGDIVRSWDGFPAADFVGQFHHGIGVAAAPVSWPLLLHSCAQSANLASLLSSGL